MTSKHFEAFAREIATISNPADAISMSRLVQTVAKEINKHFDPERFKARITELREEFEQITLGDDPQTVPGGRVLDTTGLSNYLEGFLKARLYTPVTGWNDLAGILKEGMDSWGGMS